MGVDVYGRNPIMRTPPPEEINWQTATREEQDKNWEARSEWESQNPGSYFCSNWWGWRPIQHMIIEADYRYGLNIDTIGYGNNDGSGLKTQEECDRLANALELYLKTAQSFSELNEEDDRIFLCMGSWSREDGTSLYGTKLHDELCESYPEGTLLLGGVVTKDGDVCHPTHSTSLYRINKFIAFLRECGGFEIF